MNKVRMSLWLAFVGLAVVGSATLEARSFASQMRRAGRKVSRSVNRGANAALGQARSYGNQAYHYGQKQAAVAQSALGSEAKKFGRYARGEANRLYNEARESGLDKKVIGIGMQYAAGDREGATQRAQQLKQQGQTWGRSYAHDQMARGRSYANDRRGDVQRYVNKEKADAQAWIREEQRRVGRDAQAFIRREAGY